MLNERFLRVWDRFSALEKADEKAGEVFEAYRKASNEFRGALSDQANRLLPREEYNLHHTTLVDRFNSLEARVLQNSALQTGRSSGISTVGYVVISLLGSLGVIASVTSVVVTLLHK